MVNLLAFNLLTIDMEMVCVDLAQWKVQNVSEVPPFWDTMCQPLAENLLPIYRVCNISH